MATKRKRASSDADLPEFDHKSDVFTPPASTAGSPNPDDSGTEFSDEEPADEDPLPVSEVEFKVKYNNIKKTGHKSKKKKTGKKQPKTDETEATEAGADGTQGFKVEPEAEWNALKKFKKVVVNTETFSLHDYIFIKGVEGGKGKNWVGRVMEIRAQDVEHVYIRVYWMYWPEELPQGRQPYHGENEVVMSNLMDVIDAMSVQSKAIVVKWDENEEEQAPADCLYFRQNFDFLTNKLIALPQRCGCRKPANPDINMITCGHCHERLHETCLEDDARKRAQAQLEQKRRPDVVVPDSQEVDAPKQRGRGRAKLAKTKRQKREETLEEIYGVNLMESEDGGNPVAEVTDLRTVSADGEGNKVTVPIICLACEKELEEL